MSIENHPLNEKLATPEELQDMVRMVTNWAKDCLRDGEHNDWTPTLPTERAPMFVIRMAVNFVAHGSIGLECPLTTSRLPDRSSKREPPKM